MKTNIAMFAAVLTITLMSPMFGQSTQDDQFKPEMKQRDMSNTMGKPTVDATVEGIHMEVWLTTEKEFQTVMRGKRDEMMTSGEKQGEMGGMEVRGMKETSMMTGKDMRGMKHEGTSPRRASTHHIMLAVTGESLGKGIADASAKVTVVSPSEQSSTADLSPAKGLFGGDLTLTEKGQYKITVSVDVDGSSKTKEFQYLVN